MLYNIVFGHWISVSNCQYNVISILLYAGSIDIKSLRRVDAIFQEYLSAHSAYNTLISGLKSLDSNTLAPADTACISSSQSAPASIVTALNL